MSLRKHVVGVIHIRVAEQVLYEGRADLAPKRRVIEHCEPVRVLSDGWFSDRSRSAVRRLVDEAWFYIWSLRRRRINRDIIVQRALNDFVLLANTDCWAFKMYYHRARHWTPKRRNRTGRGAKHP